MSTPARRFRVAFTFANPQMEYIAKLDAICSKHLGNRAVFFYTRHQALLNGPGGLDKLHEVYRDLSEVVVIAVSGAYKESKWAEPEFHAVQALASYGQERRVICLQFDKTVLFGTDYKKIIYHKPDGDDQERVWELIRDRLADLEKNPPGPIGGTQHRPNNLPQRSLGSLFKGRDAILKQLHAQRVADPAAAQAIVQTPAIQGEGGIGKTRLAIEYAWQYETEYSALLFVQADSPENLRRNLARLCDGDILNLPERENPKEVEQKNAVLRWLQTHPGWLLILDNVDSEEAANAVKAIQAQLTAGHVLITSRWTRWAGAVQPVQLDVLDSESSVAYLSDRTDPYRRKTDGDTADARALAKHLDGLAAMLEQAASCISCRHCAFGDYLHDWKTRRAALLQWRGGAAVDYRDSVYVTWDITFETLDDDARNLLRLLSWLGPDPIPREMFATPEYEDSISKLVSYSLVKWEEGNRTFKVHCVIQEVTRGKMTDAQRKETLQRALQVVDDYIPAQPPPNDVRSWGLWTVARPHVGSVIEYAEHTAGVKPSTRLMNELALHLKARILYREAEPLYRRALAIDETSFGPEHPRVATDLNNLAQLLKATNRLAEAEPLMRRALAIDETSFGPEHPNLAIRLNNLAALLQATNRLAEAEPLMRRALASDETSFGPEHPNVARDLNNLAQLLQATNRLAEAEPHMRRALAIDETSFGPEHPDVAIDLNNLAQLLQATNRLAEAEPLMRRALAIDETSFGPEHPNVARDLNNLALLLKATNRLAEAEPLYRRALASDETSFGPEHPDVAIDLNNLAGLLRATNRLAEAEPLYRRALAIDETSFGPDHPKVAIRLNNLAQLLQATNRLAEAEPLMHRALVIYRKFQQTTGHEHPHWQVALGNYRGLLKAMGLGEAEVAAKVRKVLEGGV